MADLTGLPNLVAGDVIDPIGVAEIHEYEAAAAITKGQAVYLSADDKVSPAAAAQPCIGIATKTVAIGEMCPVLVRGRIKVAVGGATTRGESLYGADASGRILAFAGSETAKQYTDRNLGWGEQSATGAGDFIIMNVVK